MSLQSSILSRSIGLLPRTAAVRTFSMAAVSEPSPSYSPKTPETEETARDDPKAAAGSVAAGLSNVNPYANHDAEDIAGLEWDRPEKHMRDRIDEQVTAPFQGEMVVGCQKAVVVKEFKIH